MKTAIAFSGAGANIIIEAGFAKAFKDSGLTYDFIEGTSSGGIVSAFVHAGQLDVLEEICLTAQNKDVFYTAPWNLVLPSMSFLSNSPLRKLLKSNLNCDAVRKAGKSCKVNVSDLKTWTLKQYELTKLSDDEMIDAIILSTSIPLAFPQVHGLIDGGVLRNYPLLDGLADKADRVILFVPNVPKPAEPKDIKDLVSSLVAATINNQLLSIKMILKYLPPKAKVSIIELQKFTGIGVLDFDGLGSRSQRENLIKMGYEAAKPTLDQLQKNSGSQ